FYGQKRLYSQYALDDLQLLSLLDGGGLAGLRLPLSCYHICDRFLQSYVWDLYSLLHWKPLSQSQALPCPCIFSKDIQDGQGTIFLFHLLLYNLVCTYISMAGRWSGVPYR